MNGVLRDPRFNDLCGEFRKRCWDEAQIEVEDPATIIFAASDSEDLDTRNFLYQGYVDDDDNWDMSVWNQQMIEALDGAGCWFVGLAVPILHHQLGNMLAVVMMERFCLRFEGIVMARDGEHFVPQRWVQITPPLEPQVMEMLVVPRRAIVQQG